ncbi:hypothetical protein POM88_036087 [Heracleum sosnowskyi]|uniref:Uncharacterized protein n=1 Tax=Heracleum sosnowskyi TaxID=360622 RepID=A0AAD8HMI7_9APIA|nr:hypothetical protein POM88_036087 [Heracleum sosnowskyi]
MRLRIRYNVHLELVKNSRTLVAPDYGFSSKTLMVVQMIKGNFWLSCLAIMFLEAVGGCFLLVSDPDCQYIWHSSLPLGAAPSCWVLVISYRKSTKFTSEVVNAYPVTSVQIK